MGRVTEQEHSGRMSTLLSTSRQDIDRDTVSCLRVTQTLTLSPTTREVDSETDATVSTPVEQFVGG